VVIAGVRRVRIWNVTVVLNFRERWKNATAIFLVPPPSNKKNGNYVI